MNSKREAQCIAFGIVQVFIAVSMLVVAMQGNTAMTVFYGVLLLRLEMIENRRRKEAP